MLKDNFNSQFCNAFRSKKNTFLWVFFILFVYRYIANHMIKANFMTSRPGRNKRFGPSRATIPSRQANSAMIPGAHPTESLSSSYTPLVRKPANIFINFL